MYRKLLLVALCAATSLSATSAIRTNLEARAASGEAEAQHVLSVFNYVGIEGPRDVEKAKELHTAVANNTTSQNNTKAIELYLQAGDHQSLSQASQICFHIGKKDEGDRLKKLAVAAGSKRELFYLTIAQLGSDSIDLKQAETVLQDRAQDQYYMNTNLVPYWGYATTHLAILNLGHYNTDKQQYPVDKVKAIEWLLTRSIDTYAAPYLAALLEEYKAEQATAS